MAHWHISIRAFYINQLWSWSGHQPWQRRWITWLQQLWEYGRKNLGRDQEKFLMLQIIKKKSFVFRGKIQIHKSSVLQVLVRLWRVMWKESIAVESTKWLSSSPQLLIAFWRPLTNCFDFANLLFWVHPHCFHQRHFHRQQFCAVCPAPSGRWTKSCNYSTAIGTLSS